MAKDPAFLFYPNDWIGGTMGFTFEEKGAYMELLMMQFNRGHMSEDMIGRMIGQLWVKVQVKFVVDVDGLWYNERLDLEKNKRKKFVESRTNNRLGENQHTKLKKEKDGHVTTHMENENEDINNINLLHNKVKPNSENFLKNKTEINGTKTKLISTVPPQGEDYLHRRIRERAEAKAATQGDTSLQN